MISASRESSNLRREPNCETRGLRPLTLYVTIFIFYISQPPQYAAYGERLRVCSSQLLCWRPSTPMYVFIPLENNKYYPILNFSVGRRLCSVNPFSDQPLNWSRPPKERELKSRRTFGSKWAFLKLLGFNWVGLAYLHFQSKIIFTNLFPSGPTLDTTRSTTVVFGWCAILVARGNHESVASSNSKWCIPLNEVYCSLSLLESLCTTSSSHQNSEVIKIKISTGTP